MSALLVELLGHWTIVYFCCFRLLLCSLSYVSVDNTEEAIVAKGRGVYLAKVDIQSANRMVPVHPEERPLLGMSWEGSLYFDAVLPFGLQKFL